ncbi:hypothetical protein SAMN06309945_1093 [Okibacterium fritillariae]|uniref:Uncharacterized protein n=1 Tax=Okibacterium fritillariae TaxID=123320 RepID=A0A1T5J0K5_9MICO|nr:hypothetical protein SAMN06309945_1093 [Okibacterium fritillariae]
MWPRRTSVIEYLYVSKSKLEALEERGKRFSKDAMTIGLPSSLATAHASFKSTQGNEAVARLRRLESAFGVIPSFEARTNAERDWVGYSGRMRWATMYRDSGRDGEDEVAVFTSANPTPPGQTRLVLLGSTQHLLTETRSVGRMGSSSDALYDLVRRPSLIDLQGVELPRSAVDAARHLSRILDDDGPRWQFAPLEGIARVLHIFDDGLAERTVIATPLFVRIGEPGGKQSRRRAARQASDVKKFGTSYMGR